MAELLNNDVIPILTIPEDKPRRSSFSFLIRYYPHIQGIVIAFILIFSTFFSKAYLFTFVSLITYLIYIYGKQLYRKKEKIFGISYKSESIQLIRSIILILGVFFYLFYIYTNTNFLNNKYGIDTLWLLFLLPTYILSQQGTTKLLPIAVILSCLSLFLLYFVSYHSHDLYFYLGLLSKILWLLLLSFILNILIRYIKDWYINFRLLGNVEEEIINIRSISEEKTLLQNIVNHLAREYKYPHVNIFKLSKGVLKSVVSSDPSGDSLVKSEFHLKTDNGIIGYVAREGKRYYSNDVNIDQYYYPHSAFKKTKSEIAVPIKVRGQIYGVLDIQTHEKNALFSQDIEVVDTLGRHLGSIIDIMQIYESNQRISKITNSIARRFLSQHELERILDSIVDAALEEFRADFVVLYEWNPNKSSIFASAHKGHLLYFHNPDLNPSKGGLIHRLLLSKTDYFDQDSTEIKLTNKKMYINREESELCFTDLEQISSRAIIHLSTSLDCLGIMFVNFRSNNHFDDVEREKFHTFGHLAALALEKSRVYLQQIQSERQHLAIDLHDCLQSTTFGVQKLLTLAIKEGSVSNNQHALLNNSLVGIQSIQKDIRYLISILRDPSNEDTFDDLSNEITKAVQSAKLAYNVDIYTSWYGDSSVSPAITYQVRAMLNEAFFNAIRHGEANKINLDISVDNIYLEIKIEDNGHGFNLDEIRPGGLQNIKERTEKFGGACDIRSEIGKGTCIKIYFPVD